MKAGYWMDGYLSKWMKGDKNGSPQYSWTFSMYHTNETYQHTEHSACHHKENSLHNFFKLTTWEFFRNAANLGHRSSEFYFFANLQPNCTKNDKVAPTLKNQNTLKNGWESQTNTIIFPKWMKLQDLDENITNEWV
jgi:hypothetical protein